MILIRSMSRRVSAAKFAPPRVLWLNGLGRALAVGGFIAWAAGHSLAQPAVAPPAPGSQEQFAGPTLPRIDQRTGRDLANWPPDLTFDHEHMKLKVVIPDVEKPQIFGEEELTSRAVGQARSMMTLNARASITITSIKVDGQPATFKHEPPRLTIEFAKPVAAGATTTVSIRYSAKAPFGDGVGLIWMPRDVENKLEPLVYSQGQADFNSAWFVCHDFPNDRLSTELIIDIPEKYTALSNGELKGTMSDEVGRKTWHYAIKNPHATYLVSMVVGVFDIVDVAALSNSKLPMKAYGPVGSADKMKQAFADTGKMVTLFEKAFGEPYPWEAYNQVVVRGFHWGGMENTTLTTLTGALLEEKMAERDDLVSHELCHQWFGNLITCRSWEHVWLNEGWATYSEAMWAKQCGGEDAFLNKIRTWRDKLIPACTGTAPATPAMVSNRYVLPDDTFEKAEDPYLRGGMVLHMLHARMGEDAFWKGTRGYVQKFKFKAVETDDFRRCMEEASGLSLQRFFTQWCLRPGVPRLSIDLRWLAVDGVLRCDITQTQTINSNNPAYELDLPIVATMDDGTKQSFVIRFDTRVKAASFKLDGKPSKVEVDPQATVLGELKITGDWDTAK